MDLYYFRRRISMLKRQFRRPKRPEIKKKLEDLITNRMKNENTDMKEKVNNCASNEEEAVKVV